MMMMTMMIMMIMIMMTATMTMTMTMTMMMMMMMMMIMMMTNPKKVKSWDRVPAGNPWMLWGCTAGKCRYTDHAWTAWSRWVISQHIRQHKRVRNSQEGSARVTRFHDGSHQQSLKNYFTTTAAPKHLQFPPACSMISMNITFFKPIACHMLTDMFQHFGYLNGKTHETGPFW